MKYATTTLRDRIEIIVREEMSKPIEEFLEKVVERIYELVNDEIQFRR